MSVASSDFRSRFRASIERPVAALFIRTGLSPNALTLIGFAIAVVGAALAATQNWLLAGLVVGFGAAFDLFDGALARATGKTSRLGAFMDSTFDRAGEAIVYLGIVWGCMITEGWGLGVILASAAMAAAFMVSYARAKSENLGFSSGSGMASVGLAPREVRSVILVLTLIVTGLAGGIGVGSLLAVFNRFDLSSDGRVVLAAGLGLIAILATVTTIQRILFVYRQSRSQQQEVDS